MSYIFKTEIFGLTVEVEGEFSPAEPETLSDPGFPPSFEINTVTHEGKNLTVDELPEEELADIEQAAFDSATNDLRDS